MPCICTSFLLSINIEVLMYITEVPQFLKFILFYFFVKENEVNLLQLRTSHGQNNLTRKKTLHEDRIYLYLCFLKCRSQRKILHTLKFPKFLLLCSFRSD